MTDPIDIARQVRELHRRFRAAEPADLRNYIAVVRAGANYVADTAVPTLAMRFVLLPSGIAVPERAARGPEPIDLIRSYITAEEVFGRPFGHAQAVDWVEGHDRDTILALSARILAEREAVGAKPEELDNTVVRAVFTEPHATRVAELLRDGRPLIAPQAVLLLAKLALVHSPDGGDPDMRMFVPAILALQQDLESRDGGSGEPGPVAPSGALFREIVRSHAFSTRTAERSLMTQFQLRWRELADELAEDRRHVNLEATFDEATGVPLTDFTVLGIALWTTAVQRSGRPIALSYLSSFGWPTERMEPALALFCAAPAPLGAQIETYDARFGVEWSFDPLGRYPVLRLAGDQLLVLSPRLLFERVFGRLPIFDLETGLKAAVQKKQAQRAKQFFRVICERQALISLRIVAGEGPTRRFYGEPALQRAFGSGPTADAVIDYGNAWVIAEVSSRQLMRETVVTLAATTRDPHGRLTAGAASSAVSRRRTRLVVAGP